MQYLTMAALCSVAVWAVVEIVKSNKTPSCPAVKPTTLSVTATVETAISCKTTSRTERQHGAPMARTTSLSAFDDLLPCLPGSAIMTRTLSETCEPHLHAEAFGRPLMLGECCTTLVEVRLPGVPMRSGSSLGFEMWGR